METSWPLRVPIYSYPLLSGTTVTSWEKTHGFGLPWQLLKRLGPPPALRTLLSAGQWSAPSWSNLPVFLFPSRTWFVFLKFCSCYNKYRKLQTCRTSFLYQTVPVAIQNSHGHYLLSFLQQFMIFLSVRLSGTGLCLPNT